MASQLVRGTTRLTGTQNLPVHGLAESQNEKAHQQWSDCKAHFAQHNEWPKRSTPLGRFLHKLRLFSRGELGPHYEYPASILQEARQKGALNPPSPGQNTQSRHKDGPVARVLDALKQGHIPEPRDLNEVRSLHNSARLSERTLQEVVRLTKEVGITF